LRSDETVTKVNGIQIIGVGTGSIIASQSGMTIGKREPAVLHDKQSSFVKPDDEIIQRNRQHLRLL
jgi:hypothetical protein